MAQLHRFFPWRLEEQRFRINTRLRVSLLLCLPVITCTRLHRSPLWCTKVCEYIFLRFQKKILKKSLLINLFNTVQGNYFGSTVIPYSISSSELIIPDSSFGKFILTNSEIMFTGKLEFFELYASTGGIIGISVSVSLGKLMLKLLWSTSISTVLRMFPKWMVKRPT